MRNMASIEEYFAEKVIFITGATGFLGKVLLEKLLRSCSRVQKIYLLIRSRPDATAQQRMDSLFQSKVFDRVREIHGSQLQSKLVALKGDISEENLGLSEDDWELLTNSVNIVFHSAATVRFDEGLKIALALNVKGTTSMVKLCKQMKHLQCFLHVSTAYANCDLARIEEKFYPPSIEPGKLIASLDWMDSEMVNALTPHLIGSRPNTYTFTKGLAEHLILQEVSHLPVAIFRPSIIGAALKEPIAGWLDNFNGPSGLFVAAGKGMLRSMIGDLNAVADIIPVDLAANMMLAITWKVGVNKPQDIPIYHCTSGKLQPITWGDLCNTVNDHFYTYPLEGVFRRPNFAFESRKLIHYYWLYISHKIPAFIADAVSLFVGQRPRMNKLYKKLEKATKALIFFTSRSWEFTTDNYEMLLEELSPEDRETFYFDVRMVDWNTYLQNFVLGIKQFLLKEDISNLHVAQSRIRKLRNIRWTMYCMMFLFSSWLLINKVPTARAMWFRCLGGIHLIMVPLKFSN